MNRIEYARRARLRNLDEPFLGRVLPALRVYANSAGPIQTP